MPLKIDAIRAIKDDTERTAAAEELLAYALNVAAEAREVRNAGVRKLKAAGKMPVAITRETRVAAPTVKALTR